MDLIDATPNKCSFRLFELLDLDLDDAMFGLRVMKIWYKQRFRKVQEKLVISHPDVLLSKYEDASEEETNEFAVILNAAYKTLSDVQTREPYLNAVIDFRKHFSLRKKQSSTASVSK